MTSKVTLIMNNAWPKCKLAVISSSFSGSSVVWACPCDGSIVGCSQCDGGIGGCGPYDGGIGGCGPYNGGIRGIGTGG